MLVTVIVNVNNKEIKKKMLNQKKKVTLNPLRVLGIKL